MRKGVTLIYTLLHFTFFIRGAQANTVQLDSTTIEFFDKQFSKKVKVQLTVDVPKLPANLTIIDLMVELGANEMQVDSVKKFMDNDQTRKEFKVCINEEICVNINIISNEIDSKKEDKTIEKELKKATFFPKRDVGIYIGFNQWNPVNVIRQDNKINDWRSRYFAISFKKYAYIGKLDKLEFAIGTAPEIAWYNFHLKNNRIISEFGEETTFEISPNQLRKSKLVVPIIQVPVTINVGLADSGWMLSTGPSVGLRYGGFSKVKSREEGRQKVKSDFNMSKLIIGWGLEIGKVSGMKFFLKNDFTPLFQVEGRNERVWSIGVRI